MLRGIVARTSILGRYKTLYLPSQRYCHVIEQLQHQVGKSIGLTSFMQSESSIARHLVTARQLFKARSARLAVVDSLPDANTVQLLRVRDSCVPQAHCVHVPT